MAMLAPTEMTTYSVVRTDTCHRSPPGLSRSSVWVTHPTFHSTGFQIGMGRKRIGSTVPNATPITA